MPGSGVVRAGAKVSERRTVSERRSHSTEPENPVKDAGGVGGGRGKDGLQGGGILCVGVGGGVGGTAVAKRRATVGDLKSGDEGVCVSV